MLDILPQILINGLIAGSLYALVALGLSITYGILQFINFAHTDMAMVGAYLFFFGEKTMQWPIAINAIIAILATGLLGVLIEHVTFRPLRNQPLMRPMLTSIGIGIILQSSIIIIFGPSAESYDHTIIHSVGFFNDKIILTNIQIFAIMSTIVLMTGLFAYLKYTRMGKAIRAVADNAEASAIMGIQPNRVIKTIFFIGSCLAGFAGIIFGYNQSLQSIMGVAILPKAFAAVLLGGMGNIPGAIIGGFIIGIAENLAIGITPLPATYKDAVAFIIMILILLFRPRGLLGHNIEFKRLV